MDIETDCIISPENLEQFEPNGRRQYNMETVKDFLDRGLLTRDAVYQRYTTLISNGFTVATDNSAAIESIKESFQRLRDPATNYLSQAKFRDLVVLKVGAAPGAPEILFDILSFYAFFPFPSVCTNTGVLRIDEDAFLRAFGLLTPPSHGVRYGFEPSMTPRHDLISGSLGPHRGWFITGRGKGASDFGRWLFRSLAVPTSTSLRGPTTMPVPRFIWYEPRQDGSDPEDDPSQQLVIMENEDESSVDIVDAISECLAGDDRNTARLFRECYRLALPSLPKHNHDLSRLTVPTPKVLTLLKLIQEVERENNAELVALIETLESWTDISWELFDGTLSKHAELVASSLSKIFKLLVIRY